MTYASDRQIAHDRVAGGFMLPPGLRLFDHPPHEPEPAVLVSTVMLDGGHLEDPLGIVEPETGFETMVFIEGCRFFSLYTEHYKTRAAAKRGHSRVLERLRAKTLPLSISVPNYWVQAEAEAA